ncbi:hypothetical protein MG296_10620 [Flavobacteriaceae bacterium TK19130]|nr:hypothetical protein [Thermobacterium salinum]
MTKKELEQKAKDLGIDVEALHAASDNQKATNKELEAAIKDKEAELNDTEVDSEEVAVYEDKRGLKWSFKPSAPKTINIDGKPMTQQEIMDDESVISELVFGNCNFLTQNH